MKEIKKIISPDTQKENRLPPGQFVTNKFPILHYSKVPDFEMANWKLKIKGLVEEEKAFSYDELTSLEQVKLFCDVHCVETWSKQENYFDGISTSTIKELVQINTKAKYVLVYCSDGYTTNLNIDDFFKEDSILALKYNNEILSPKHGWPLRLIIPHLYFWKSGKWVENLEFSDTDKPGYWETKGYHNRGNVWMEERFSK